MNNRVVTNYRSFKHHCLTLDVGRRANYRTTQFRTVTNVGIVPHNTTIYLRTFIKNRITPNHTRTVYYRACTNLTIMAQINWPIELSVFINLDPLLTPYIATNIFGRDLQFYLPLQDISIGTHIFAQATDITPVAFRRYITIDRITLLQHVGKQVLAEIKRLIFLKVGKNLWMENVDTRIDCVAEHLSPAWLLQKLGDMTIFVGNNYPILQRIMHMCQEECS